MDLETCFGFVGHVPILVVAFSFNSSPTESRRTTLRQGTLRIPTGVMGGRLFAFIISMDDLVLWHEIAPDNQSLLNQLVMHKTALMK